MEELRDKLRDFAKQRDWDQFHSPKNLAMALSSEVGELVEIFQWLTSEQSQLDALNEKDINNIKEELSDIFIYLIRLADKLNIDLIKSANDKILVNAEKYPVELSKGNATKYNRR